MSDRTTIELGLDGRESAALDDLAAKKAMSRAAVLRQALRLYQTVEARLAAGETMSFSGDAARAAEFAGPLAAAPAEAELIEREAKRLCAEAGHGLDRLACHDRRFAHDDNRPYWQAQYVYPIEKAIEDLRRMGFDVVARGRGKTPAARSAE